MILFLGVDGGQSSTRAVIGDEGGRVRAAGAGGPVDHADAPGGADRLRRALTDAVGAACARLGLDPAETTFEAAFGGFTGGPEGKGALMEERIRARRFGVSDDAVTALTGALAGEPGIVTVAGTGSICFGRNAVGDTARAGGWGFAFGDEGSAFDLTRRALRAALRLEEGWGPPTALHGLLQEALNVADIRLVQRHLYATDNIRRAVAALAPLVDQAARPATTSPTASSWTPPRSWRGSRGWPGAGCSSRTTPSPSPRSAAPSAARFSAPSSRGS